MKKIWKTIEDFPNYEASTTGKIRNSKTKNVIGHLNSFGYEDVSLNDRGIYSTHRVHRIVAKAFLPNPEGKPQVNHKDGDKLNNSIENLEWCTNQENQNHAWDTGLMDHKKKRVKNIKTGVVYDTIKQAASENGIAYSTLCQNLSGRYSNRTDFIYE